MNLFIYSFDLSNTYQPDIYNVFPDGRLEPYSSFRQLFSNQLYTVLCYYGLCVSLQHCRNMQPIGRKEVRVN